MAFMDKISSAGSIGLTTRPKSRAIDKILMRNRDEQAQNAHQMNSMMGGGMAGGQGDPGNPFGGSAPFNRPDTLAMMLGR